MSAGPMINARYTTNEGTTHRIRIQPETAALVIGGVTNNGSAENIDSPGSAVVSRGRRCFGINARAVTIKYLVVVPGYTANPVVRLPVMRQAAWDSFKEGQQGTYRTFAVECIGKTPERIR